MLFNYLRHLTIATLTAAIVGSIVGGAEGLYWYYSDRTLSYPVVTIFISLLNTVYAIAAALVIGLIAATVSLIKRSQRQSAPLFGKYLVLFVCLYGGLFVGTTLSRLLRGTLGEGLLIVITLLSILLFSMFSLFLSKPVVKIDSGGKGFKVSIILLWAVLSLAIGLFGVRSLSISKKDLLASEPSPSRPNILIVLVDALRPDHLGCYGYERDTSPAVDALAEDGVLFSRCIAQSSWTRPSVSSLLTGTVPPFHRSTQYNSCIDSEFMILPDDSAAFGYNTVAISASHLITRAFNLFTKADFFVGPPACLAVETGISDTMIGIQVENLRVASRVGREMAFIYNNLLRYLLRFCNSLTNDLHAVHDAKSINRNFMRVLDKIGEKRFFTYLHYMEPHAPYDPEPPFDTLFKDGDGDSSLIYPPRVSDPDAKILYDFPPPEDAELEELIARYDGDIAQFSHYFGLLIAALKARDLYDDLLIIFISDHGEEFYDHKSWEHRHSLYDELIEVPLIVKFPKNRHKGLVVDSPCSMIDVVATLFDYLQLDPWEQVEGRSLIPLLENRAPTGDQDWFSTSCTGSADAYLRCYIENNHKVIKAIKNGEEKWFLFDIEKDPEEKHSIVGENPELFGAMRNKLEEFYSRYDFLESDQRELDVTSGLAEKLRALGYTR